MYGENVMCCDEILFSTLDLNLGALHVFEIMREPIVSATYFTEEHDKSGNGKFEFLRCKSCTHKVTG